MAEYFEEEFIFDILSAGCKKYNIFALICGDNNQTADRQRARASALDSQVINNIQR